MNAAELSRRTILKAAALAGAFGLVKPDRANASVLTSDGSWFDLAMFTARSLGSEGRITWFSADWGQVIENRKRGGELPADYAPHPSAWYAAVYDRTWLGDRLIVVNPETRRYVVADIIDVHSNPNAVGDLSTEAFEELGVPRSSGVQTAWVFRVPAGGD